MDHMSSRYREPPVALAPDARGRTPATVPLRVRADTTGSFRHVVAEGERLDHIAYQYYEEPTDWWQFCDANPEFLSPLALLGQEPISTVRLPLRADTHAAPTALPDWATVKSTLAADSTLAGVEDISIVEDVHYAIPDKSAAVAPQAVRDVHVVEVLRRSLLIRFNSTSTSLEALLHAVNPAVKAAGLALDSEPIDVGQIGGQIVIPASGTG